MAPIGPHRQDIEKRLRWIKRRRNWTLNRRDGVQVRIGDRQASRGRWVELQKVEVIEMVCRGEYPIATADRGLVVEPVGEPDAWSDVVVLVDPGPSEVSG
jgi:hypothetical protein